MPDDAALAQVLQHPSSRPQSAASVLLYQDKVTAWWRQGIRGTVIHQALVDTCGYASSYSSIRRFLQGLKGAHPDVTTELDFDPGDVAQVDFGRGPTIKDVLTHQSIATWIFVMVLAWSRHQYAEIVPDQKVETWLCCHRRRLRVLRRAPAFLIGKRPVLFAPESGDTLRRVNSTRRLVVIWVPGLANALLPTDTNCTKSETIPDTRTPETGT